MPLWLSLQFPLLGLQLRWRDGHDALPAQALFDPDSTARRLLAVNPAAVTAGITVGQTYAQAQALTSTLLLHPRDELAESRALEHLATWAYRYSDEVRLQSPASVALEIGNSLKLFGGLSCMLDRLHSDLQGLGLPPQGGLGRSLAAARLRAELATLGLLESALAPSTQRTRQPSGRLIALDATPVQLLPLSERARTVLHGSGVSTLAALLKLPAAALQRRFGSEVGDYLQRLQGLRPEPGQRYQPPQRYRAELELPAPTALGEALWFPLKRLLGDLCLALTSRDLAVDQLQLFFELEHGDDGSAQQQAASRHPASQRTSVEVDRAPRARQQRIDCQLLEASRDPQHLFELCRQRIDRVRLSGKVLSLCLEVPRLPAPTVLQAQLFDLGTGQRADWPRLLERLRARLGEQSLRRPQALPDHRPERAAELAPLQAASVTTGKRSIVATQPSAEQTRATTLQADLATRPSWLLQQTEAIDPSLLTLLSAAERIEGGWWDGHDIRRDYYRAQHAQGGQCWVYQELRPPHGWYVHGWFG